MQTLSALLDTGPATDTPCNYELILSWKKLNGGYVSRRQSQFLNLRKFSFARWRHQMETFSALLAICEFTSEFTGEFPTQRPVTRSFDVFFDLRLNKRLRKQLWGWWFETPLWPLWRHCNGDLLVHLKSSLLPRWVLSYERFSWFHVLRSDRII